MTERKNQAGSEAEIKTLGENNSTNFTRMAGELAASLMNRCERHSSFYPSSEVEVCLQLGNLTIYRRLGQFSSFLGTLFRFNLLFFAAVVFYCTYQLCSSGDGISSSWLGPPLVGAILPALLVLTTVFLAFAAFLWFLEIPRRLKVLDSGRGLMLRIDITGDVFAELLLPWSSLAEIQFVEQARVNPVKETFLVIKTVFGLKHYVRQSDLLLDNSEASFLNAVATWAPHLLKDNPHSLPTAPQFTELWLHQFSTANKRKELENLPVGTVLKDGLYEIAGILGDGGQGTAYLAVVTAAAEAADAAGAAGAARDQYLTVGREVVLKEYILPVYQGSKVMAGLAAKLFSEAEVLRQLSHGGVVKLYDCFCQDYRGYLVLEFIDGCSFKDLVNSQGPMTQSQVVELAGQLCCTLIYLHGQNPPVIHRDLSPDNIMLSKDGEVKIVDFNVAKRLEPGDGSAVVGKHAYIPPEQFRGKPTAQSDIYAFGCTLFFLLTGEEPEPLTVSHPRQVNSKVSESLDQIVSGCTALDQDRRFQSFAAVLDELVKVGA